MAAELKFPALEALIEQYEELWSFAYNDGYFVPEEEANEWETRDGLIENARDEARKRHEVIEPAS